MVFWVCRQADTNQRRDVPGYSISRRGVVNLQVNRGVTADANNSCRYAKTEKGSIGIPQKEMFGRISSDIGKAVTCLKHPFCSKTFGSRLINRNGGSEALACYSDGKSACGVIPFMT